MATINQIKKRASYERYLEVANKLNKLGIPKSKLGKAIQIIHDDIMEQYCGYRSHTASLYAQESINLIKKELK